MSGTNLIVITLLAFLVAVLISCGGGSGSGGGSNGGGTPLPPTVLGKALGGTGNDFALSVQQTSDTRVPWMLQIKFYP